MAVLMFMLPPMFVLPLKNNKNTLCEGGQDLAGSGRLPW